MAYGDPVLSCKGEASCPFAGMTRIRFKGSPRCRTGCRYLSPLTGPPLDGADCSRQPASLQGNHCMPHAFYSAQPMGTQMADGNGNNGMLYFIVGALVVVVAAGAFFMFGGHVSAPNQAKSVDVKVEVPKVGK